MVYLIVLLLKKEVNKSEKEEYFSSLQVSTGKLGILAKRSR
jgi:hypothetical protein